MNLHEMPSGDFGKAPDPENQLPKSYSDQRMEEMMARLLSRIGNEKNRVIGRSIAERIETIDAQKAEVNELLRQFINYCRENSDQLKKSITIISENPNAVLLDLSDVSSLHLLEKTFADIESQGVFLETKILEGERAWDEFKKKIAVSSEHLADLSGKQNFQGAMENVENKVQRDLLKNPEILNRSKNAFDRMFINATMELSRIASILDAKRN